MPGLPKFPEKMAYVIHTKYQYRGKPHNLRSNVVWIYLEVNASDQIFITKSPGPDAESHGQLLPTCHSTDVRSSTLKKTLATTCSSGAHVLAHILKSFVDSHTLAAKSINIVRIWASDNLPIILLADLIQNVILVPMRAYFSATLNVDPLAFTQTSSYCSTKHLLNTWGKQALGHSKIWEKNGTTKSVFRARTRSWESACQFSWPFLSQD